MKSIAWNRMTTSNIATDWGTPAWMPLYVLTSNFFMGDFNSILLQANSSGFTTLRLAKTKAILLVL
jgi:hypothetical protein